MSSSNSAVHTMPREITREIHEHEVMLCFNDDFDAERFNIWWYRAGFEAFGEWIDEGCPG